MKRSNPTGEFWTMLTIVNVLGLTYPVKLLLHANSLDETFSLIVYSSARSFCLWWLMP
jgi:hypothetical protein